MSLFGVSKLLLRKGFIRPVTSVSHLIKKMSSSSLIVGNKVEVNGANIYYEKAGHGKHTLLCLPGALGSCETDFKPQLETLNHDKFTVICWDPRGYGKSRPPDRDFPLEFFFRDADDAGKLMEVLGYKSYSALGWSDGANTAMILAAKRQEAVEKLVVWGGNAYCTDKDIEMYEFSRDISNWSERMRAPMIKVYGEEYFKKTWSAWVDGFKRINDERRGDVCLAELKQIKCPTLILHGELDPMVATEHPVFLQTQIAGSRMHIIPGAKHNPHLRYPKDFNQHLETFFLKGEEPEPFKISSSIVGNKVDLNGVNIYYEKAGHGKHVVLLLPGGLGSCETDFRPQLETLNHDKFTVICWDPRGYGKSRPPDRDFPVDFLYRDADDAGTLMEALGYKHYSALGWSDGANTAMILAAKRPEAVEKLVVWGGNSYTTEKDMDGFEATRDLATWSERMRAPMVKVYGRDYLQAIWSGSIDGYGKIVKERNGNVYMDELSQIKCPTFIIHGELDPLIKREHPVFLHEKIQGSRLLMMPKAKHNPHLRYPEEFNQHVETFLLENDAQSKM